MQAFSTTLFMCSSWKGCGELSVAPKRDVSRAVDGGGAQVRSCHTLPGGGLCGPWEERGLRHAWAPRGREEAASGGTAVGSVLLNRAKSEGSAGGLLAGLLCSAHPGT